MEGLWTCSTDRCACVHWKQRLVYLTAALSLLFSPVQPDDCPPSCVCARESGTVSCRDGEETEVPAGIPRWATTLILRGNNITTLQSGVFSNNNNNTHMNNMSGVFSNNNNTHMNNMSGVFSNNNNTHMNNMSGVFSNNNNNNTHVNNMSGVFSNNNNNNTHMNNMSGVFSNNNNNNTHVNSITTLHGGTDMNMETLSLSYNGIRVIEPHAFLGLTRLHVLDLSYNSLVSLSPASFSGLAELRSLYLNHSVVVSATARAQLYDALGSGSLRRLQRLELAGNHLTSIPLPRLDVYNLHTLVLTNNSIENLGRDNVSGLYQQNRIRVFLAGNPFRCNCDLEPFYYWLKNSSRCPDVRRLVCSHPEAKRGLPLEDLREEEVDCMKDNLEAVSYVFLGMVLALIGVVFLMVLYLNRKGIKRWLNNIRDACRDQMEVYHYRYEQDSDPRLANVAV